MRFPGTAAAAAMLSNLIPGCFHFPHIIALQLHPMQRLFSRVKQYNYNEIIDGSIDCRRVMINNRFRSRIG